MPVLQKPEVSIERGLYGASSAALLDRVREIGAPTSSALLIGHQPAIRELALTLAGDGDAELRASEPSSPPRRSRPCCSSASGARSAPEARSWSPT